MFLLVTRAGAASPRAGLTVSMPQAVGPVGPLAAPHLCRAGEAAGGASDTADAQAKCAQ